MKLVVFSHKECWISLTSRSGFASEGGFPIQMRALSTLFEETALCLPKTSSVNHFGEVNLDGRRLRVTPLSHLRGHGLLRKLLFPIWLLSNFRLIIAEIRHADAVHCPIPGDVGSAGMLLAVLFRKPLFVRYCGQWGRRRTMAERFWHWFMHFFCNERNVMVATGCGSESLITSGIRWIFSASLGLDEFQKYRRKRIAPSEDAGCIIYVGRQTEAKGVGLLLQAMPHVLRKRPYANAIVVGDGPALSTFRKLALDLQLDESVRFTGKLDHAGVMNELSLADVFVFPTYSEGFPKVAVEAMACGLPLLCSNIGVLEYLVSNGAGQLFRDLEPETIAEAICDSFAEGQYEAMSNKALETASQFSLESWQESIQMLLSERWGKYGFKAKS